MISVTIALIITIITIILLYSKNKHTYWSKLGIPTAQGSVPILGHAFNLMMGERWTFIRNAYKLYSEDKVFGVYEVFQPTIFVCDPNMARRVLIKDFDYFTDRRTFAGSEGDSWFSEMLSLVNGEKWKKLRSTMSPTFSSGKMKHMYPIVDKQARNFVTYCENQIDEENKMNLKKAFGYFTMDVISETAFGIECNSLLNGNSLFAEKTEKLFETNIKFFFKFFLIIYLPKVAAYFNISFEDDTWLFLKSVSQSTLSDRRKNENYRGDFLDLLMDEQKKQKDSFDEKKDYEITDRTILAESALFLMSGYDTTANAMSLTAFFLAKHPEYQNILRTELEKIYIDGKFEYHDLMEAKYLDACISEALRLVPPLPWLERKCVKDYYIEECNITVKPGMIVGVPAWGIHRDPIYWPEPNEFKPERFMPENKSNIEPYTYMPFGLGPRNCLAMRFALMETKQCLSNLIMNFKLSFPSGMGKLELENGFGIVRPTASSMAIRLDKISL